MAEQRFSAPNPGMAMTRELGSRPWQRPPQYSTIEDVTNYYTARFRDPVVQDNILSAVQTDVPLVSIANSLQTIGVMEGKHSNDLGVLVSPILVQLMKMIADEEEVKYNNDYEDKEGIEESLNINAIQLAAHNVENKRNKKAETNLTEEEIILDDTVETEAKGLMSRRIV